MNWKLLKGLSDVVGIPGQEELVHSLIKRSLTSDKYEIKTTPLGNLVFREKGNKKNRIAVCSHSDEVGFFVRNITKEGFAEVLALGGLTTHSVYGSEFQFITTKGKKIYGSFVQPSIHELRVTGPARRRRDINSIQGVIFNSYFEKKKHIVDFGFKTKEEAEKNGLRVGCQGTFATQAKKIGSNRMIGKALDNRIGTFLNLESANASLVNKDFAIDHIFGVREEIGAISVTTALFGENYKAAIALDVSPARQDQGSLGKGPLMRILDARHIGNPILHKFLEKQAKDNKITIQPYVSYGGTDAGRIHTTNSGIPTLQVSMTARSIHTGISIADLDDIEETQKLLNLVISNLNSRTVNNSYKN